MDLGAPSLALFFFRPITRSIHNLEFSSWPDVSGGVEDEGLISSGGLSIYISNKKRLSPTFLLSHWAQLLLRTPRAGQVAQLDLGTLEKELELQCEEAEERQCPDSL